MTQRASADCLDRLLASMRPDAGGIATVRPPPNPADPFGGLIPVDDDLAADIEEIDNAFLDFDVT